MTKEIEAPKRRGRPPASDEARRRHNLTFRIRTDLKESIEISANKNGKSLSEEIEYRLESFARLSIENDRHNHISSELIKSNSELTKNMRISNEMLENIKKGNIAIIRLIIGSLEMFINGIEANLDGKSASEIKQMRDMLSQLDAIDVNRMSVDEAFEWVKDNSGKDK